METIVTSYRNGYVSIICVTLRTITTYSSFLGFTSCGFPHYYLENILHININIKVIIHSSGSFWNSQKIIYHIGVRKKSIDSFFNDWKAPLKLEQMIDDIKWCQWRIKKKTDIHVRTGNYLHVLWVKIALKISWSN